MTASSKDEIENANNNSERQPAEKGATAPSLQNKQAPGASLERGSTALPQSEQAGSYEFKTDAQMGRLKQLVLDQNLV